MDKMSIDFGEVVTTAWKIVWKFKVLWVFGILASCGTGNGGNFNSSYRSGSRGPGEVPELPPGVLSRWEQLVHWFENPAVIAGFVGLLCLFILLAIFLGNMGRIGLIKGTAEADGGAETLTFGGLWKGSLAYFWRVLLANVIVGLPFFVVAVLLALGFVFTIIPLSENRRSDPAMLALLPVLCVLFCVLFLLSVAVAFVVRQAENAIVIENESIPGGLRRGWDVLVKNLGPILIIWIITVAIGLVAGIVIALPLIIVALPLIITFLAGGDNASYTPLVVAGLCVLAYIPVSLLAHGILIAYLQAVWTLAYLRLTKPKQGEQSSPALPANA
jgi:hypothetical protein